MATTGNRKWAYTEAKRRTNAMAGPYSIYRHKHHEDYIIRTAESAAPNGDNWQRVATFQADGTLSFQSLKERVAYAGEHGTQVAFMDEVEALMEGGDDA